MMYPFFRSMRISYNTPALLTRSPNISWQLPIHIQGLRRIHVSAIPHANTPSPNTSIGLRASTDPPILKPEQLEQIQGDIWSKGFPKYNETYFFFTIVEPKEFTRCLRNLVKGPKPLISNLLSVAKDHTIIAADRKKAEDEAKAAGKSLEEAIIPVRDIAHALIAFSSAGLRIIDAELDDANSLELGDIASTDSSFMNGMHHEKVRQIINDPAQSTWDPLFQSKIIHGLLKIGGSSEVQVEKLLDEIKKALKHGTVIRDIVGKSMPTDKDSRVDGAVRPGLLRGKEHFGFEDGISQPRMSEIDPLEPPPTKVDGYVRNMNTDPNVLIVTKDTAKGGSGADRPEWMHNGSFLVFRKLEQNVRAFNDLLKANWQGANLKSEAHLGAKLMGRWESGAPLGMQEFVNEDTAAKDDAKKMNAFGYRDQKGCPVAAHVRKTNPRVIFGSNSGDNVGDRTRMLRHGIAYGTQFNKDRPDDSPRGLLFACYQAFIEDSFHNMQASWSNHKDFHQKTNAGIDPIIGQAKGGGDIEMKVTDQSGNDWPLKFKPLVTLKGGGYFFVPSIKALREVLSRDK